MGLSLHLKYMFVRINDLKHGKRSAVVQETLAQTLERLLDQEILKITLTFTTRSAVLLYSTCTRLFERHY